MRFYYNFWFLNYNGVPKWDFIIISDFSVTIQNLFLIRLSYSFFNLKIKSISTNRIYWKIKLSVLLFKFYIYDICQNNKSLLKVHIKVIFKKFKRRMVPKNKTLFSSIINNHVFISLSSLPNFCRSLSTLFTILL